MATELRGYLYRDSEGNVVLADVPNLKSCCLGNVSKVYVSGSFPEKLPAQMSTVKGTLEGERLVDAELVSTAGTEGIWIFGILLVCIIGYFLVKRRG